jgi:feruloyl-CoA synthase
MGETNTADARATAGFAPRAVDISYRADGTLILRSPIALGTYRRHLGEYLEQWAAEAPDRTFLAKRGCDDQWVRLSYGTAWQRSRAIGQALLDHGLEQTRPIAILTGNSLEHALLTFAGMLAAAPVAPISPAYGLHPDGLDRLAEIAALLQPAVVFVQSTKGLDAARKLPGLRDAEWVSVEPDPMATPFTSLEATAPRTAIDVAFRSGSPDDVAKILFTSGSTGSPKGVPQTQRMLCSSLHAASLLSDAHEPPVMVDWMPWHHTMGGNNTLLGVLRDGGTLYIDDGRPTPELFGRTIRNLREISITSGGNVPAGLRMLVEAMEHDDQLRTTYFAKVRRIGYAGASLPRDVWERLQALALRTTGRALAITSGYGTTETAPGIATTHWPSEGKGELGLPIPGVEVKLVPLGDRYEVRARGANVMPGYLGRPDLTAAAFDEEGFYKVGDAVKFVDPGDPRKGLRFAGRLSENFKLTNGSWVLTGELRTQILAAAPSLGEAVIAGHDRDDVRLLVWATPALCADLVGCGLQGAALETELRTRIAGELRAYNVQCVGTTRRVAAFMLLTRPPSLGAGEITDKGYVNQRQVLANNAAAVEELYAPLPSDRVIAC